MTILPRHQPTDAPDAARLANAHRGVLTLFLTMGALMATFLARLPSVRDLLDVSEGELARLIVFGALGALCALLVTGWAAAKFGTRSLLLWSTFGYTIAFSVVAVSTDLGSHTMFAAGHFFASFNFAFANVAMNAEGAAVERGLGRSTMPRYHAGFSIGMALALAAAAFISHAGISPMWHLLAMSVAMLVVRLAAIGPAVVDGRPRDMAGAKLGGPFAVAAGEYRERQVLLIGAVIFAAAMTEMSAGQWVALSIVDDFGLPESIGDLSYWVFVATMVSLRWLGSPIIDRLGRVTVLRLSAVSVVSGLLIFAFAPGYLFALPGLVLWGMGAALAIPIGFSAASDVHERAAARVAAVSSFSTVAGLIGPQVIGYVAEASTIKYALLIICAFSVVSFLASPATRKPTPDREPATAP